MNIQWIARIFFASLWLWPTSFAMASSLFTVSVSGTTLTITSTAANHTYPAAGIKINTPSDFSAGSGCTLQSNGFCTFSVSDTVPAHIVINGSTASTDVTLCLNGVGALSCQHYSVALTGPVFYASTKHGVVQTSTNRGVSWTATAQPGGNTGHGLWFYNNVFYMGSPGGNVEQSLDSGASWSATGAQPDGSAVISVFSANGSTLYAGTQNGNVAISSNRGVSWNLATVPYPVSGDLGNVPVTGIFVSGNTLYVTTGGSLADGNYYSKLQKSTDGGQHWSDITPAGFTPSGAPPTPTASYDGVFMSVFVLSNTLYAETSDGHTFISTDGGGSWTDHYDGSSLYTLGVSQLYVKAGTPNTLYAAGDGFTYVSVDDGETWSFDLSSPGNSTAYGLTVNGNRLYVSTLLGDLSYHDMSDADPGHWTSTTQQPGGSLPYGLLMTADGTYYVGGSNGELSFSATGGQTWASTGVNPYVTPIYATFMQGDTLYAGNSDGSFWQYQAGSWTLLGMDTYGAIFSLAANGSTFFDGDILGYVNRSTDGGANWTALGQPDGSGVSSLVAVSNTQLYAGTQNGHVAVSTDGGATWALLSSPDGSAVNGLQVDTSTTPYTVYAGTGNGNMEISTDGGSTWTATSSQPDASAVLGLVVR